PARCPAIPRRPLRLQQPPHRPAVDPHPHRDLPLRDPIRRQRLHLRPLQRAPHLLSLLTRPVDQPSFRTQSVITSTASGALFTARTRCSIKRPTSALREPCSADARLTLKTMRLEGFEPPRAFAHGRLRTARRPIPHSRVDDEISI